MSEFTSSIVSFGDKRLVKGTWHSKDFYTLFEPKYASRSEKSKKGSCPSTLLQKRDRNSSTLRRRESLRCTEGPRRGGYDRKSPGQTTGHSSPNVQTFVSNVSRVQCLSYGPRVGYRKRRGVRGELTTEFLCHSVSGCDVNVPHLSSKIFIPLGYQITVFILGECRHTNRTDEYRYVLLD